MACLFFVTFSHAHAGVSEILGTDSTAENPVEKAFDGGTSAGSFWEAVSPFIFSVYPLSATLVYDQQVLWESYTVSSGDSEPNRMPSSWKLEGSVDNNNWYTLDQRTKQPIWSKNEQRTFAFNTPNKYLFYRLTFSEGYADGGGVFRIFEIKPNLKNAQDMSVAAINQKFRIQPGGVMEWPGALRISKSAGDSGLPNFEDGRTRAQPGGTLVIQPQGDLMRNAIDMLPTSGTAPDTGAHAEITLHRRTPDAKGYDMVSFAALARDDLPFGILLEYYGEGEAKPFVFMNFSENAEFTQARFQEPLRITKNGTVQIGRKRGVGSTGKLENNDPAQVDALFIEREDPLTQGNFDSDYFKITAKNRNQTGVQRYDWRMNVQVDPIGSSLVIDASQTGSESPAKISFHSDGTLELMEKGAGIILNSPNGQRWLLTVDDQGQIITNKKRPLHKARYGAGFQHN